jgi:hypothetical protein
MGIGAAMGGGGVPIGGPNGGGAGEAMGGAMGGGSGGPPMAIGATPTIVPFSLFGT